MKDWLKSPEPEAMMGPKTLGGLDDVDESSFEPLPPPEYLSEQDSKRAREVVQLPSLKDVCRRILFRSVAAIEDLGDMPFTLVQDVLEVMRPDKLQDIEASSPHLAEHTDYIWKRHVLTEFPKCRKAYEKGELPEPTRWRTQYLLCGEERERELDHLGSKLKERYAEAQEQRSSRKMVITERAPVQAGRRTTGTTVAGSTGAQSKGSKILSRARGQALRLRGPRRAAPVRIVGDAHISFLDRWNPPAKNSFEGAAFTTSVAPPPKPASVRPVAPRPSTSDTAPPRLSARHATAAPLPADPAAAPPILDFFGASASKPSRSLSSSSSSKRSRTVTTVSVQKKRKVQATGPKGLVGASIYPLSSPPHSASSPASSAGSPTLVHPGGCAPSWNSEMSPASPSSATTLEDAGSGCSSRGLDFFGPSSQRCKPGVRSGNHAVLQKQAHPVVPAPDRASTKGSALDSSPTLPAGIRSQTVAAALYAQANGQTTSDDEFK